MDYISANDERFLSLSDSDAVTAAVKVAKDNDILRVVIPRVNKRTNRAEWIFDKAVLLPSNIEIVLDNCYIRQADGIFDNVFRNENFYDKNSCEKDGEQHNIVIRGVGNAVIDGGNPNGLTEKTSEKDGYPHIRWNNTILLHNIREFTIENITIKNQRWWGINLIFARNGRLSNIKFDAKNNIPNQDGIDLRVGCTDIIIENICGQGGDDLVALSGFKGGDCIKELYVPWRKDDICNIIIKNIMGTSVRHAIVALRNQDGIKLHDITIDSVCDTSHNENGNNPYAAIRIGNKAYANKRFSILGETARIFVSNVHSYNQYAVMVNVTLTDSVFKNIYCSKKSWSAFSTKRCNLSPEVQGAKIHNTVIENVFFDVEEKSPDSIFNFFYYDEKDAFKNVIVRNVFTNGCENVIEGNGKDCIITENIF